MLVQLLQNKDARTGYTKAVDYWGLGVTLFALLTGGLPFKHTQVAGFLAYLGRTNEDGSSTRPPDYDRVSGEGPQEAQDRVQGCCRCCCRCRRDDGDFGGGGDMSCQ